MRRLSLVSSPCFSLLSLVPFSHSIFSVSLSLSHSACEQACDLDQLGHMTKRIPIVFLKSMGSVHVVTHTNGGLILTGNV